ncbi:hypothetical protein PCI56_04685 [Plesiomonas shigelloides subsp. oncorhynchi]|nr:hypothetical protein [Plesiomonas shigelloides]
MLAAELEAEKALAGLGFGDAMEMLKSTSNTVEEKPKQEDSGATELPKPDVSKKGKQQSKQGKPHRRVIQRNKSRNQRQKKICHLRT